MGKKNQQSPTKKKILLTFILSCLILFVSIGLVIAISLLNLSGLTGQTSVTISSCTDAYFASKYNTINHHLQIAFIPSVITIILSLICSIFLLYLILKRLNVSSVRIKYIYIISVSNVEASILSFGKYMTFYIQFNTMQNCSANFTQSSIPIILGISATLIVLSLLQFITILLYISDINKDQLYKQAKEQHEINKVTQENMLQNSFNKQQTINNIRYSDQPLRPAAFSQNMQTRYHPEKQKYIRESNYLSNKIQNKFKLPQVIREEFPRQNNILQDYQIDRSEKGFDDRLNVRGNNSQFFSISSKNYQSKQNSNGSFNKYMKYFKMQSNFTNNKKQQNLSVHMRQRYNS